jgi:hypothetical protein
MPKELLETFEISVGNFMRKGCHVGLVGANPTWLKTKLHTCLKSRIPVIYCESPKINKVVFRKNKGVFFGFISGIPTTVFLSRSALSALRESFKRNFLLNRQNVEKQSEDH